MRFKKGMVAKWDPVLGLRGTPGTLGTPGTPRTSCNPENRPGSTDISQDMMCEKYFSGIIISFLYLRNYKFSVIEIGLTKLVMISC